MEFEKVIFMDALECIMTRRSVREFEAKEVEDEKIKKILEAGQGAPSGLNNQPWKFVIIKDKTTNNKIAEQTKYSKIIKNSPLTISVFFDQDMAYDRTKDVQSIGACLQNMLLSAHAVGLGAVWLGEILNKKEKVNEILQIDKKYELMAVIALGYPIEKERTSKRKPLKELIIKEI